MPPSLRVDIPSHPSSAPSSPHRAPFLVELHADSPRRRNFTSPRSSLLVSSPQHDSAPPSSDHKLLPRSLSSPRLSTHPPAPVPPSSSSLSCASSSSFAASRRFPILCSRFCSLLHPYTPFLIWAAVSICVALVVLFNHSRIFAALDALSVWLRTSGTVGILVLFLSIFVTTIPPLPLYSTFIILSGYAFGNWKGFAISYAAALSGAVAVFLLSRYYLRSWMLRFLSRSKNLVKVVTAIEKRPKLLFLIRLSPYPYNVINVLLASSETLSLRTFVSCTALSLFKLIVHTTIGSTIRNFARYHSDSSPPSPSSSSSTEEDKIALDTEESGRKMKTVAAALGGGLCVAVFVYLFVVARRAVDEEVDACSPGGDDDDDAGDEDEFLPLYHDDSLPLETVDEKL